jgi:hypothetical protein
VSENLVQQISGVTSRFDSQGNSMVQAANALEHANSRIDSTLSRMSGKAEQLDQVMRGYTQTVEGSIANAEARARQLLEQLANGTAAHSQAALEELDRLRVQTDSNSRAVVSEIERLRSQAEIQASRTLEDMRNRVSGVSQEMSQHLGSIANRFNETSDDLRARASRAAAELHMEQERLRSEADRLPVAARESADAMRAALSDQLRALEQLSTLSARERRDVTPPGGGGLAHGNAVSLTAAYAQQQGVQLPATTQGGGDNGWSLGDLLDRASQDDDGTHRAGAGPSINTEVISRALDATTASAIWSRFRSGQRGIMVRSIYTAEGRATFDDTSERYKSDPPFQRMVDRFLHDFEQMLRNVEQKDPSGRGVHNHLISDSGRVYLFLAHASGRLR